MKLFKCFLSFVLGSVGLYLIAVENIANTSGNISTPLGLLCLLSAVMLVCKRLTWLS